MDQTNFYTIVFSPHKEALWFQLRSDCVLNMTTSQDANRLASLVVKASASGVEDQRFESRLRRDFSGSSHTSDFKIGTAVTTLPGAWRYRVSASTGRPGVSTL